MPFNSLRVFVIVLGVFSFTNSYGQEEVGDKKTQHPDAVEWYKRTQKLAAHETRLKEKTKQLQDLIKTKNSGQRFIKDEKQGQVDILGVIATTHRELLDIHKQYEDEKREVKYRYPGEGDLVERRYMSTRPPTIEQLEREMGLDGQLSRLSQKIDEKYSHFNPPPTVAPSRTDDPESTLADPKAQEEKKRLRLVR